jgi:protein TonB
MAVAIFIHAMVLTADTNWLRRQEIIVPQARIISMQLIERAPYRPPAIQPLSQPPPPLPAKPSVKPPVAQKPVPRPTPVVHKPKSSRLKTKPVVPKASPQKAAPTSPPPPISAAVDPTPETSSNPPSPVQETTDTRVSHAVPTAPAASDPSPTASDKQATPMAAVVMATPRYNRNPPPAYPSIARKRGYEGTVILDVFVKTDGRVGELRVATSSSHKLLDRSAVKAVKRWQFEPGKKADEIVAMWVKVPVVFRLR